PHAPARELPMKSRFLKFGAMVLATAAGACTASISGPDGDGKGPDGSAPGVNNEDPPSPVVAAASGKLNLRGTPTYYRVVRLTNEQWTNSAQKALALPSPPTQSEAFQDAVSGTTDFTNNELVLDVDGRAWSDYQSAAEALAA